jgi:AcrR family transcriptional regulator
MKALKQRRAPAARPQEIIDAALIQFVETGFAGTRLDDVARRAGLSKAAIYLYFEDKTALFKGVVQHAVGSNLGQVEAMLAGHRGPVAPLLPRILEFMALRIETSPMASVAKLVISESRAFPEIGRFYLEEVIGRGLPLMEGLIRRGIERGEFRKVDAFMTVRSMMGPMLLAMVWRTVFEPIGAEKLDVQALARHHADLMLHALRPVAGDAS